ncbi:type VII toxin-antitoxin system HepT family RNase toxin [Heliorestis convoluta]|uniref:DUF86 domain-containing protein n=1 Tax=Heliorestis convoluta TaxID=356322 RepID=A0A5Q2N9K4_9FIRM|nr:DUF86 domain-containing protein [Heliorestis convoluta]QGG48950.1 hypothetical protein FTV88_2861 [Heliorestis convoluta]
MVDHKLLTQKITLLTEYIKDLTEIRDNAAITLSIFKEDKVTRRYVERTLHLAVECTLDIGSHIIADEKFREPISNKDVFTVLADEKIITPQSLAALQKMAKFRNVLVHDYAKIDPEIIYSILKKNLKDIEDYMEQIIKSYL